MTDSMFGGICSAFTTLLRNLGLWSSEPNKRLRDSEDEEDGAIGSYQFLKKRPKLMTHHHKNMTSGGGAFPKQGSSRRPLPANTNSNKNFQRRLNPEVKENSCDVIDISDEEYNSPAPVESRPPLSDLAVRRSMTRVAPAVDTSNTATATHSRPHHVHERRQNGVHPSAFNTFTRSNRISKTSTPKPSVLNEMYEADDRQYYSQLLADYQRSASISTHRSRADSVSSPGGARAVETIDLTTTDPRRTHISVKPYQSAVSLSNSREEELPTMPYVNSLEKRLSQNSLVSSQWIIDMKRKYCEKERETQRLLEEAKLTKELYAKHNHKKVMEALDARIRRHLSLTDVILDDTEDVITLAEITPEMKVAIEGALKPQPSSQVLVEGFGQRITRHDIQTLNKLNWLNDEVINFYMNLLIERGKNDKRPSVYAFNTFFYPKLVSQGYNSLRRWTKKVDIFDKELLLVPIHLGMHWCMATVDFRDKTVRYYDSMGSSNNRCLNALLQYLKDESMDKKKKVYDTHQWKTENVKEIPQQMNGSDCGMFSCMFAEYLSRNAKITFSQKDMPYFRQKMVYEIISQRLLQ